VQEGATTDLDDRAIFWQATSFCSTVNDDFDGKDPFVAFVSSVLPWHDFFENIFPDGTKGMQIRSTCDPSLTYEVQRTERGVPRKWGLAARSSFFSTAAATNTKPVATLHSMTIQPRNSANHLRKATTCPVVTQ
jgi:hypothetical protein